MRPYRRCYTCFKVYPVSVDGPMDGELVPHVTGGQVLSILDKAGTDYEPETICEGR